MGLMSRRLQVLIALGVAIFVGATAVATRNPGLYILTGLAVASSLGLLVYGRDVR
jgi:hypothetical protein